MELLRTLTENTVEFLDVFAISLSATSKENKLVLIAYLMDRLRTYGYDFKSGNSFSSCLARKGDFNKEVDRHIRLIEKLFSEIERVDEYCIEYYLDEAKRAKR